jgi:hypothetical protein
MNKLTLQFLIDNGVCDAAAKWTAETFKDDFAVNEVIDWYYGRNKLLSYIEQNPNLTGGWLNWFDQLKNSEQYVRFNGSIFTMGAYQVFNPLTGVHTRYETESEAKAALIEVAQQVLQKHCPIVVQEITNENGDTSWTPTTMNETLVIS